MIMPPSIAPSMGPLDDGLYLMVTDVSAGEKDYVDFLCTFHRGVRDQVEGGKK